MKGQSSAEAMVGVAFMLMLLILVLWQGFEMDSKRKLVEMSEKAKTECFRVQAAISSVYSVQENAQAEIFSELGFRVSGNSIIFDGFNCDHVGTPLSKTLNQGNVRIKKVGGALDVSNF